MKNFTKQRITLTLALVGFALTTALAQTPPNPVAVPAGSLYKHTTNSTNTTGPVAEEATDLVTTGTRVPYLVMPDKDLNPLWSAGTNATNTSGITSTWTWSVASGISSTFVPASNTGHYITVDVDGTPSVTASQITVQERNGTSCPGSTVQMNVQVIAKPTASALGIPSPTICPSGTNGSLNVTLPVYTLTFSKDAAIQDPANIKVIATLSFTALGSATPVDLFADKELNVASTGVISNADLVALQPDFDSWGTYTLTIKKISDKISRKDIDATRKGYFDVTSVNVAYTVLKAPATGAIYHLPNM